MTQSDQPEPYATLVVVFDQLDDDMSLDSFLFRVANFNNAVITSAVVQRILTDGYFPGYGMTKYWEEVHGDVMETVTLRRVSYNSPLEIAIATEQLFGYAVQAFAHIQRLWGLLKSGRPTREVQNAIEDQQLKMIAQVDGWDAMTDADRSLLAAAIAQKVDVLAQIQSLTSSRELPRPR